MTTPTVDLRNTGSVFDRARGWVVSTLVHGLGITGSLFVMGAIEQPPPPSLFQWDIAMVESPAQTEAQPAEPMRIHLITSPTFSGLAPRFWTWNV